MSVYDSLGNSHQVSVYFVNTAPGTWDYHELANGAEVQGGTAGQNIEIGSGTLTFDTNGALVSNSPSGGTVSFNNAASQAITLNLGTPTSTGGTGLDGITQFGGEGSVISAQKQDGYASGALSGVQVGQDGTINGVYTNGQSIPVAQLAIAKFPSDQGLAAAGGGVWSATTNSGQAALGAAGSAGRGAIVSGSLEQSNVDIASQFVDLIAHQRGFQASSKTITTADQMLQDLMQIVQ